MVRHQCSLASDELRHFNSNLIKDGGSVRDRRGVGGRIGGS